LAVDFIVQQNENSVDAIKVGISSMPNANTADAIQHGMDAIFKPGRNSGCVVRIFERNGYLIQGSSAHASTSCFAGTSTVILQQFPV
jgi:hypothetical protein